MKTQFKKFLLAILVGAFMSVNATACPAPGTYTIGPTGNYTSITLALTDLGGCTLTGAYLFELQAAYSSSVETFPLTVPFFAGGSLLNTITFRPQAGATNLLISSTNSTGTLLLNGANYIVFDGRAGGAGTIKNLTIQNTNVGASYAVQLVNDASNNSFQYCNIRSANNSITSGTIVFSSAGSGNGNDNNAIDNCDVFDAGTGTPLNAVYQSGTASPKDNSSNTISNNKIYNFYSATANMNGVLLANNASSWIISTNSFYQTVTRNLTGSSNIFSAIQSAATSVTGLSVIGNYIGGTSASAGGTAMTITGSGVLSAIQLISGTTPASNVLGNTIRNISLATSSNAQNQSLINLVTGKFNVGSAGNPNILGSQSATGSITVYFSNTTAKPNNPVFSAIYAGSGTADIINISYNTIGGLDFSGLVNTTPDVVGIYFVGAVGTFTINNNIIGSLTTANSITSSLNGNANFSLLQGISGANNNSATTHNISGNTIANISTTNTGVKNAIDGIYADANTIFNITNNSIYNLSSTCTSSTFVIYGIRMYSDLKEGQKISNNKIYNLINTAPSASVGLCGIYYYGSTTGVNIIEKNFIHSLTLSSTAGGAYVNGILADNGTATFQNNMVRLGFDANGSSITKPYPFFGIRETGGTNNNNFYFNSSYIGGSGVSASSYPSYAFHSNSTGARNIQNNIFFNARSNAIAGGANHVAMRIRNLASANSNYNDLFATGVDGVVGSYNVTIAIASTLSIWQTNTALDANSISGDPKFIAPNGNSSTVDLHINSAVVTPIESAGILIAGITDDFDGQPRASFSPTDIGADAGNFIGISADVGAVALINPAISSCFSNATQVSISVKNYGAQTIDLSKAPITVTVNVTGVITQTVTGTVSTGTLAAGASITINTTPLLNMSAAGTYTFNAFTTVAGIGADFVAGNNAMTVDSRTAVSVNTWTGGNTNWNDGSNWCGGAIPTNTTDVTIPDLGVGANYPIITSGVSAFAKNISIATNASVVVNASGTLTLSGAIVNNGTMKSNGLLVLDGTVNTNFPDASNLTGLNNLTINKTGGAAVTFNKAFQFSGTFTPTSGTINVNDVITVRSTFDTTARVGQVGASFVYNASGKFEVQRYIPARRSWRLLTSPLSNTTSVFDSWQNSGSYIAGKGFLVSGAGAAPLTNGLDVSPLNNFSSKTWDTTTQSLSNISNTLTTLLSNNINPSGATNTGYFVFVRGDRNPLNFSSANVNTTTISSTGRLQTGNQLFNAASPSGSVTNRRFTLIGNPYASPIDFALTTKTNLLDQFTVWDPIPLEVGRYVTVIKSGASYIMVPDRGVGGPNQFIQSGQAFFVETDLDMNTAPTLGISETNKSSNNSLTVFRPTANPGGLRINLLRQDAASSSTVLADGVYAMFDNAFSKAVTKDEPQKFVNINENLSLKREGQLLVLEKRPIAENYDTLFLQLSKTTIRSYSFDIQPSRLANDNRTAVLEDTYLHQSTEIDLNNNTNIAFDINNDAQSAVANRFRIVMRPVVDFVNVDATLQNTDVQIEWMVANEYKTNSYVIERSTDGVNFYSIGLQNIAIANLSLKRYHFANINPLAGIYYYRIKAITENGKTIFSTAKKVVIFNKLASLFVFPNPVEDGDIQLHLNKQPQGNYSARLINSSGQVIYYSQFSHAGGNATIVLHPAVLLVSGNYALEISGKGTNVSTIAVNVK